MFDQAFRDEIELSELPSVSEFSGFRLRFQRCGSLLRILIHSLPIFLWLIWFIRTLFTTFALENKCAGHCLVHLRKMKDSRWIPRHRKTMKNVLEISSRGNRVWLRSKEMKQSFHTDFWKSFVIFPSAL